MCLIASAAWSDKSLVRLNDQESAPRYSMLETIREFALNQLAVYPDEERAARQAHASYFAQEREQVAVLAEAVQEATGQTVAVAWATSRPSGDLIGPKRCSMRRRPRSIASFEWGESDAFGELALIARTEAMPDGFTASVRLRRATRWSSTASIGLSVAAFPDRAFSNAASCSGCPGAGSSEALRPRSRGRHGLPSPMARGHWDERFARGGAVDDGSGSYGGDSLADICGHNAESRSKVTFRRPSDFHKRRYVRPACADNAPYPQTYGARVSPGDTPRDLTHLLTSPG